MVNGVPQVSGSSKVDFSEPVTYILVAKNGDRKNVTITLNFIFEIPKVVITTDGNSPIVSRDIYLGGSVSIDGKGDFPDYQGRTSIRGRGQSSWSHPKKSYRLKLDTKESLFGLPEEKDWVLIANYLDPTLSMNATAYHIARLLEMPYTNHAIPVELEVNGEYLGCYMFSEQIEVDKNRIPIEDGGQLIELDKKTDPGESFISAGFNLPVNVKYPKVKTGDEIPPVKAELEQFEALIKSNTFPANNYLDKLDLDAFCNFLIVNMLTANNEISWPKSFYIYRPKGGKYTFGPVWDFDWGFGYMEDTDKHFIYNVPTLREDNGRHGGAFVLALLKDPKTKKLLTEKWKAFKTDKYPALIQYINHYSKLIKSARAKDHEKWKRGAGDLQAEINNMINWLNNRVVFLDTHIPSL